MALSQSLEGEHVSTFTCIFGAGMIARPFLLPAIRANTNVPMWIGGILLRFMANYGVISRPEKGLNTQSIYM